jgi:hypothetical protein
MRVRPREIIAGSLLALAVYTGLSYGGLIPARPPVPAAPPVRTARFYAGAVRVSALTGTIRAQADAPPDVKLEVTFRNTGSNPETIRFGFEGTAPAGPITLGPRSEYTTGPVPVASRFSRVGPSLRRLTLALLLQVNGRPLGSLIDSVDILIEPPPGITGLVSYFPELREEDRSGVRCYRLRRDRFIPTDLVLSYTRYPATVRIVKTVAPDRMVADALLLVRLEVTNFSPNRIDDLVMADGFDPHFIAAGSGGFTYFPRRPDRDPWLRWQGRINSLEAGDTQVLTYLVRLRRTVPEYRFRQTAAYTGTELIGSSNEVVLRP